MSEELRPVEGLLRLALLGPVIAGGLGLLAAVFPFLIGDFLAAGICLLASSVWFGLFSIAVLDSWVPTDTAVWRIINDLAWQNHWRA